MGRKRASAAAGDATEAAPAVPANAPPSRKRGAKAAAATAPEPTQAAAGRTARQRKPAQAPAAAPVPKAAAAAKGGERPKPDFYLMKSEPHVFSIDQLADKPQQTEAWDGVRNYVARNHMRGMRVGDRAFFYHSSCKVPGIVGIVKVVREAYPDHTQYDKGSDYYDPKATPEAPRWFMVDIQLERRLARPIPLEELKGHHAAGGLGGMALFNTARLSVQPVAAAEWDYILALEGQPPPLGVGGGGGGKGGGGGSKEGGGGGGEEEGAAAAAAAAGVAADGSGKGSAGKARGAGKRRR